mmetsp:Transcript_110072/g.318220  ORF Transcript_110072/g.318220 Transcript_110072/m.318220 type:complete len:217 (-) Transcript_110072:2612-3262(-)
MTKSISHSVVTIPGRRFTQRRSKRHCLCNQVAQGTEGIAVQEAASFSVRGVLRLSALDGWAAGCGLGGNSRGALRRSTTKSRLRTVAIPRPHHPAPPERSSGHDRIQRTRCMANHSRSSRPLSSKSKSTHTMTCCRPRAPKADFARSTWELRLLRIVSAVTRRCDKADPDRESPAGADVGSPPAVASLSSRPCCSSLLPPLNASTRPATQPTRTPR